MTTTASAKTETPTEFHGSVLARILEEGYGPGAWHGADLKAAVGDVGADLAFRRPAPGRHNIAEIALHHAYTIRTVRGRITGRAPEPFPLDGEDWFELSSETPLAWDRIRSILETEQQRLADLFLAPADSPERRAESFDLALGITCHAIYHAGQVQLLKRLAES